MIHLKNIERQLRFIRKILLNYFSCILIFPLLWPNGVLATEDDDDTPHTMAPVVVTATRSPISKQDVAANVTVITAEDLEQMPAANVAQALQYVPGASIQFNGGPGSDGSGVRIQGSESRHVAIFQDGVPLNQWVNPRTDLSYVPLSTVERIEIYKGSASSAWGSGLGGVINIITKAPAPDKPVHVDAEVSYGNFDTYKSRAAIHGTQDKLGWLLSYTREQNDGFIEYTDYELNGIYAKLNYDLGETSRLNLALSHNEGRNEDPVLNFPDIIFDDIKQRHSYQRLLFETAPTNDVILTVEGRHRESKTTIDDIRLSGPEPFLDYWEELWGASFRLDWKTAETNAIVAGFDGDWGRFKWDPFVDERREDSTGEWAAYINDTLNRGPISLVAGARYDHNKDYGSTFSPSMGAVYRFDTMDALVRTQVAKGFSAPDFAQVLDPTFGNTDLDPEEAVNYQLGGEIQPLKWLHIELNLFRAEVDDLIVFESDTLKWQNIESVTRQGIEWNLAAGFDNGLTLRVSGSYTDVEDDTTGRTIQNNPRTQHNISLLYAKEGFSNSLIGKYVDYNAEYDETKDKVFIFDYLFKYKLLKTGKFGRWSLYGNLYNIFNSTFLIRDVWPQPGRWVEAGVRWEY